MLGSQNLDGDYPWKNNSFGIDFEDVLWRMTPLLWDLGTKRLVFFALIGTNLIEANERFLSEQHNQVSSCSLDCSSYIQKTLFLEIFRFFLAQFYKSLNAVSSNKKEIQLQIILPLKPSNKGRDKESDFNQRSRNIGYKMGNSKYKCKYLEAHVNE